MSPPERMELSSMNMAAEKRDELKRALAQSFPEVVADGVIDFDQLKRVLGEWVEPTKERYGLNWPGKAECLKIIQQASVATLTPVREHSVEFDDACNVFIDGDNLEVLKLLQKSYFGRFKMIYIDPPYNTGNEFIYPDKFSENLDTYLEYTGQSDSTGKRFSTNVETGGRYHTRWLNMMLPRLYLSRNLLRDDGVIFVSINDAEASNLKALLDEVYGEENFISQIVWQRSKKGDSKTIASIHEYILVYAKNKDENIASGVWRKPKQGADEVLAYYETLRRELKDDHNKIRLHMMDWYRKMPNGDPKKAHKHYNWSDARGLYFPDNFAGPDDGRKSRPRHDILHPISGLPCEKPSTGWRWDEDKTKWALAQDPPRIHFGADETTIPNRKSYLAEISEEPFSSVFYADGRSATLEVEQLIGKGIFPFPKNKEVIADLIALVCKPGELVLDFFAGSASTGHAAMHAAVELGKSVNFVLVQLPEVVEPGTKASEAGFRTIADVGRARLDKAIASYGSPEGGLAFESTEGPKLGFRAFSLTRSNFKTWDVNATETGDTDLSNQLDLHVANVAQASTAEGITFELLLKSGFPLTTKIELIPVAGKQAYAIEDGALLICLEKEITPELIDGLAELKPLQVICLDEGFKGNDQLKANAVQTFKARAQAEESEIVFRTV